MEQIAFVYRRPTLLSSTSISHFLSIIFDLFPCCRRSSRNIVENWSPSLKPWLVAEPVAWLSESWIYYVLFTIISDALSGEVSLHETERRNYEIDPVRVRYREIGRPASEGNSRTCTRIYGRNLKDDRPVRRLGADKQHLIDSFSGNRIGSQLSGISVQ